MIKANVKDGAGRKVSKVRQDGRAKVTCKSDTKNWRRGKRKMSKERKRDTGESGATRQERKKKRKRGRIAEGKNNIEKRGKSHAR